MRAGAAHLDIQPPLGLPMIGFVRQQEGAHRYGLPLEVGVLVLEQDETRVVLCGLDTLAVPEPEVDQLRAAVSEVAGAEVAGVLLNWNHTHCAPPACSSLLERSGLLAVSSDTRVGNYWTRVCERVLEATRRACQALEPARVTWGVGEADLSVNRRERGPDGTIVHGWRRDALLDRQLVALQARRRDESPIATLVCFGCHTVSVGMDFGGYSSDFPGALRDRVREWVGGDCLFFQGAAGNVLPRISFVGNESEAVRMGGRLAIEAVHALSDRVAWPKRLVQLSDGSLIPMLLFRFVEQEAEEPVLRALEQRLAFPLQSLPTEAELEAILDEYELAAREAEARGAGPAEIYGLLYHAKWARRTLEDIRLGRAPTEIEAPIHAVRIGDGVIITAPGEPFTEIGMAVKERSPGEPTLFAGYVNGAVGYFPTEAAYAEGGYEPVYSNRSYGRPAPVAPECERLLVEHGVHLAEQLFPERQAFSGKDWKASGHLPLLPPEELVRPPAGEYAPPPTAPHPGEPRARNGPDRSRLV